MARAKKKDVQDEPVQSSDKVLVSKAALETAWSLIHTREWPISMILDLAAVKAAFHEAVDGKALSHEAKGANKA